MSFDKKKFKKIKGDASFRSFFRNENKKKKTLIVYADKEKEKNLLIYDSINKLLIKNKILAPKLYSENYKNNYIEIEDFGDETLYKILKNNKINKIQLFKKIILLLKKIQKIKQNKTKNFKNRLYKIPVYNEKILFNEARLFCEWYVPKVVSKKKVIFLNKKLKVKIKFLLSKIKLKNNIFVHRDFHVSNLMKYKKNFAVIDNQDALIGNKAYDLASLIDDVRLETSNELKNLIYKYYLSVNKNNINKKSFKNDFEILSILRNLKIIGIFMRLAIRDKKRKYLNYIPYAWKLIELRLSKNILFKDLKFFLDVNFPNKIRIKK